MDVKDFTGKLDKMFKEGKADAVPAYFEECKLKAKAENDKEFLAVILNEEIGYFRQKSKYARGIESGKEALRILEELGQNETLPYAMTLLNQGTILRAAGKLDDAVYAYSEVFRLFEMLLPPTDRHYAEVYNNVALLYEELGRFDKAEDALMNAIRIGEINGTTVYRAAVSYANLGQVVLRNKRTGLAMYYFILSDKLFNEKELYDNHHALALSGMAEAYTEMYRTKSSFDDADKDATYISPEASELIKNADIYYKKALNMIEESIGKNKDWERLNEKYTEFKKSYADITEGSKINQDFERVSPYMSGMDMSIDFYEKYGKAMIHEKFPEYESRIAVGKAGEGSECFGFDDLISRDHDFKPGFSMWLSDEDYDKIGESLSKEYETIYDTYISSQNTNPMNPPSATAPGAENRYGVRKISDFYESFTGKADGPKSIRDWAALLTDESIISLAAATNGRVFRDDSGVFSGIRENLLSYFPERLYIIKLAEAVTRFGQAAQYNYARAVKRKDAVSASLERDKAVRYALYTVYLLNRKYHPHDKWMRRGITSLPVLSEIGYLLDDIALLNVMDSKTNEMYLELISRDILSAVKDEGIFSGSSTFLPDYAEKFNRRIELMDMDVDALSEYTAKLEFKTFDKVRNKGGRAYCQNDWPTFRIMRKSQYMNWTVPMLVQYIMDFEGALSCGRNMITEKYGYMMEFTRPEEFAEIKDKLPKVTEKKRKIVDELAKIHVEWTEDFGKRYPSLIKHARTIHSSEDIPKSTSSETYLKGELYTYSDTMLMMYGRFIVSLYKEGINLTERTVENTVKMYGYESLEDAAKKN